MRSGALTDEIDEIPEKPWPFVYDRIRNLWVPKDAPHHSVLGLTGSGKSYLVRHGLLPMVRFDHVCIIDVKGDDPTLAGLGKPVRKLPSNDFSWKDALRRVLEGKKEPEPERHWYRLMVPDAPGSTSKARIIVEDALKRCYAEGNWVVVIDETRHLTDKREPFLDLGPLVEHLWMKGRSRRVPVIAASQEPRWLPGSFYSQASFVWIGRLRDERMHIRLTEVGGMTRKHLPTVAQIKPREWLVGATGAHAEFYRTQLTSTKTPKVRPRQDGRKSTSGGQDRGKMDTEGRV